MDIFRDGVSRYLLMGILILGGAGAAHPQWFSWVTWGKPDPWHLLILAAMGTVAGNTWFAFHRYGVYQLIDAMFHAASRKGSSEEVGNYVEEPAGSVAAPPPAGMKRYRDQGIPEHSILRISNMHLMYVASEISIVFSFYPACDSFFEKHALALRIIGGLGLLLALWQDLVRRRTEQQLMAEESVLKDIHYDFDKYDIRAEDAEILNQNYAWFKQNPGTRVKIEGNCDERGTVEYNLVLGQKRADSAKSYLTTLGVQENLLDTVSYGKERPLDSGHNEAAWAKNRRSHFVPLK